MAAKTVKITLEVPTKIHEYFKENCWDSLHAFYQRELLDALRAELDFHHSNLTKDLEMELQAITDMLDSQSNGWCTRDTNQTGMV